MGVTTHIQDELRLARLRERLEDRPNNLRATVQAAHLEYHLGLLDDAERSIAHALKLGHPDDGSMQIRLARIHVRRHNADTSNSQRDLRAALASFYEALKFRRVESQAVHYLEITSVYLKLNETQRAANALSTILVRWPVSNLLRKKTQSREAVLAREACAQTLMARGQASEALHYYQSLLVNPLPGLNNESKEEEDHAEVELPVVGSILGSESIFLQEPYTWFAFGEMLLKGDCFAPALTFLDKAAGLLPPGLQQQEKEKHLPVYMRRRRDIGEPVLKTPENFGLAELHLLRAGAFFQLGRFSDAYSAAAEARDLEPFGRAVRLLCPRLMALHSKDAGYQYTRESLAAARIQRVWREYHVVHALRELVEKQIAAMRIQRFMREWARCNHGMAIQLVTAGAIELGRMRSAFARGMGLAAQAAAVGRHEALIRSALSAQRAGRALIARRKVASRREAITILQSFFRGCRERVALSAALEERCLASRQRTGRYKGEVCSGADGDSHPGVKPKGEGRTRLHVESDGRCSIQVGIMTRRNVPMDAGCPAGFDTPNLAAFLWKHDWNEDDGFDAGMTPAQCSQLLGGDCVETSDGDAVFEVSARAFVTAKENGEHGDWRHRSNNHDRRSPFFGEETHFFPPVVRSSLRSLWVPVAVAPEKSLARALECSTLIVNSPSFGSACARRLFSRIGRPTLPTSARAPHSSSEATANGARETAYDATVSTREGGDTKKIWSSYLQGDRLTHIIVSGDSPIGDGGLSELSSVMRRGLLPRLVTLVIGGRGCRVGPRGVKALAAALSSATCASRLRTLSMSNCCLGRQRRRRGNSSTPRSLASSCLATNAPAATIARAAAHTAWDCLFRHLQRMTALSSLSLQDCGLDDGDMRPVSIAVQILPAGRLRCLRLSGNSVSAKGLQVLLRALTSRKIRLPALWLRRQRPALAEDEAREAVTQAFSEGLFAEVEFERPRQVAGGRSQLALLERTTESQDLGSRARTHPTSHIYV